MADLTAPLSTVRPSPVDGAGLVERLRLTVVSAGYFLLFVPALALAILTLVSVPTGLAGVGLLLAGLVVPATGALTDVHRRLAGALLDREIRASYRETTGRGVLGRPLVWLRDPARWRDVAFLAFSATGGALMSALPPLLLATPIADLVLFVVDPSWVTALIALVSLAAPLVWWLVTPPLVRARVMADRGILDHRRVARLERRVERVTESRSQALDHSAAEVRRIERDLHDGAQARIASIGMNVGLAEKLMGTDPEAAAELLREARASTVSALEELRSVVRGIHPPVLADRGLAGAVEALAVPLPMPVTVALDVPARLPAPVESAAYFAVAECLANTVKHAAASRAWVTGNHDGDSLRLVVGDDGRGGADPTGSGLAGVGRRLAAFDGTMTVRSPAGGPTVVTMEVPCSPTPSPAESAPSSPRTRPSSASG